MSKGSTLTGKSESDEKMLRRMDGLANEMKMLKLQIVTERHGEMDIQDQMSSRDSIQKKIGDSPPKSEDCETIKVQYTQDFVDTELQQITEKH